VSLKNGKIRRKQHIGNTVKNEFEELESMKVCIWA